MGQKVIVHVFSPEDIQTVYRWKHSLCMYQEEEKMSQPKSNVNANVFQIVFLLVHQDKLNYQCVSNSVEGKWPVIPPLQETTVSTSSIIVDDINL